MEASKRIENALAAAIDRCDAPSCPPQLRAALRHSVFPGGARVRPRLCLAVSAACGEDDPVLAEGVATSLELLHCASLVHDDLPCFDDATTRRGRASVHRAFGERLAVLAGDALIVMAFETLARAGAGSPHRLPALLATLARAAGAPSGLAAGQAWECEPRVAVEEYHRGKTGSLFEAATVAGAQVAGAEPGPWRVLGERLGEAYQVADDIRDVADDPERLGKPVGQDQAHGAPNVVSLVGLEASLARFDRLLGEAMEAIPECRGAALLRSLVHMESVRLIPKGLARRAA